MYAIICWNDTNEMDKVLASDLKSIPAFEYTILWYED